jgi:hypothetical protein
MAPGLGRTRSQQRFHAGASDRCRNLGTDRAGKRPDDRRGALAELMHSSRLADQPIRVVQLLDRIREVRGVREHHGTLELLRLGRDRARKAKVEHIIQKRDGTIGSRNSYGNAPHSRLGIGPTGEGLAGPGPSKPKVPSRCRRVQKRADRSCNLRSSVSQGLAGILARCNVLRDGARLPR